MKKLVLKFGGSSLGAPERLRAVLQIVASTASEADVEVVVSALGETTDRLLAAGEAAAAGDLRAALTTAMRIFDESSATVLEAIGTAPTADITAPLQESLVALLHGIHAVRDLAPGPRDELLSFGERLAARLITFAAQQQGMQAVAVDAREWLRSDERHGDASVLWEPTVAALAARSDAGQLRIHTGFLGRTQSGRTTTLGRNGSDYTAAILARARGADEVHIWTDVGGIMTADPSLVAEAYPVPYLSYQEALELSGLGLKMLHPRTMLPLIEAGIPMRIRNTLAPGDAGTRIDAHGAADADRPACVTSLEGMTLFDIEGSHQTAQFGLGPRVAAALHAAGISVWLESQGPRGNGIALVVTASDVPRARAVIVTELARGAAAGTLPELRERSSVTLLTLVAEAMGRGVNVAGRFFGALGRAGIPVRAASQTATSRAIRCVVDGDDTALAVRSVHAAMNLAPELVSLLLLGKGTVGSQLLAQLSSEKHRLRDEHDIDLRLVGLADSRRLCFDPDGLSPSDAVRALEACETLLDESRLADALDRLARLPLPILVDCTAANGMERCYEAAFARGIHVVGANKKPLAIETPARRRLDEAARAAHRAWRYETTVGASLPVIETLKNLVRTGDRVLAIEASLSGTLGFLSNALMAGTPLSAAVLDARSRGYTEPHPRDDLGGVDAARKALILARELGLELGLDDVETVPFVPPDLLAHEGLEQFFEALRGADARFAAEVEELRARGEVLRYLARIQPGVDGRPSKVQVGPVSVPADHPATRLRGTEAFVAFTTERYRTFPLVVQGAGAGGDVTAAGVLADILAISQAVRGR
jgi:aspartokinase/homoserine dehydrogenase 1